jgi:hypothetical protein
LNNFEWGNFTLNAIKFFKECISKNVLMHVYNFNLIFSKVRWGWIAWRIHMQKWWHLFKFSSAGCFFFLKNFLIFLGELFLFFFCTFCICFLQTKYRLKKLLHQFCTIISAHEYAKQFTSGGVVRMKVTMKKQQFKNQTK